MPGANTIVIMGASGDLTRRKLIPALFQLACKHRLPENFRIVGFSRSGYSDDAFRELMWDGVRELGELAVRRDEWSAFAKSLFYVPGDLANISEIWRYGSVVRSWLLDLIAASLKEDPGLESLQAYVDDSGEGRWTVDESIELAVPVPVITASLQARFRSRQDQPFGVKLLAAMRNQFGGHAVRRTE